MNRQLMLHILLALSSVVLMSCAGVSSIPEPQRDFPLRDTQWILEYIEYGSGTRLAPAEDEEYRLIFGSDDRLSGTVYCNAISAAYSAAGGELFVGPIAITRALCPPSAVEPVFLAGLNNMTAYTIRQDHLIITPANYDWTMVFFAETVAESP